jgi:hypothetical protein
MIKTLNGFLFWSVLLSGFAVAQDFQRAEILGGYSYLSADTNGLTPRQSFNGWEASISTNINKWLAAEEITSGYYKGNALGTGVDASDYGFVGGPRFNFRPAFVHALVGVDYLTGSYSGLSASQNSFAAAFGGGVQWPLGRHFAVRASADWLLTRHNILGGNGVNQNNVRVGIGVVYTFGVVQKRTAFAQEQRAPSGGTPQPQPIGRPAGAQAEIPPPPPAALTKTTPLPTPPQPAQAQTAPPPTPPQPAQTDTAPQSPIPVASQVTRRKCPLPQTPGVTIVGAEPRAEYCQQGGK